MLKIYEFFYHLQGKDPFVQKKHTHNDIELIQVINGNGFVLKNDKTYILQSQSIYLIDARRTHIVYPEPDELDKYIRNKIVINATSFENFLGDIGFGEILDSLYNSDPISTVNEPEIDCIFKKVSELCGSGKPHDIGFAHGYVINLIHWIYSNSSNKKVDESKSTIQKMLDIINEKEGLTSLDEIAKTLYMDKHYLCHLFKSKTGITLSAYLADKIYEKSCRLLKSTTYTIETIASMCGFSSTACFSRFFKAQSGISASKYRSEKSIVKLRNVGD